MRNFTALLILFLCFQFFGLNAQKLPKSELDLYNAIHNFEEDAIIKLIHAELRKVTKGSAEEAHYQRQLSALHKSLNQNDSATYYRKKVDAFWGNFEMKPNAEEYFGQYLLGKAKTYGGERAMQYLDSAKRYLKNREDQMHADVYQYIKTSIFNEESLYIERGKALLANSELTDNLRGDLLLSTSVGLASTNYLDSAAVMLNQMNGLALNKYFEFFQQFYLSYAYLELNDLKASKQRILVMKGLLEKSGENPKIAAPYHSFVSNILAREDRLDSAIYHQLKGLEISNQSKMIPENMAVQYADIGKVYEAIDDYKNAEVYVRKAIKLLPENSYDNRVMAYNLLFKILLNSYAFENEESQKTIVKKMEALMVIQNELVLKSKLPERLVAYNVYKGHYLLLTKRYRSAETVLRESNISGKDLGNDMIVFDSYQLLAGVYNNQGKYDLGLKNAQEASQLTDDPKLLVPIYELLMQAYIRKGDSKMALEQFEALRQIKEDQIKAKTELLLAEFEVKQELETQKLLNENLENEQLVKAQLINRQQIIIVVVSVSIIIILFILFRIRALQQKNIKLIAKIAKEGEELQATNLELGDTVSSLKVIEEKNQTLLDDLSVRLTKVFNSMKGLRSFIPEVGKLNTEQSRYFDRMTELMEEEEESLNKLVSLNSVLGQHKVDIRRVSLSDTLEAVKGQLSNSLRLNKTSLEIDMSDGLVFLADRELIEMSIVSLVQHSLGQELVDNKMKLSLHADDGLQMVFEFRAQGMTNEQIQAGLVPSNVNDNSYLNKIVQLKELMDGELQYLCIGDLHKITMKLNLIEIKQSETNNSGVNQLEIDKVYDQVMDYLVTGDALANADLTLVHLSEVLSLSTRKISFVVNTREKTNFSKFLSRLRIERVKKILDDGGHSHLNIAGIGYEAGFNSKSTFFSSFKEFVGCTPKEYLLSLNQRAS